MTAGDLIHRVTIQTRTETDDTHGGFTTTWAAAQSRIACRVESLAGRDLERARQIDPRASHGVTLVFWRNYPTELDGGRARLVWHDDGAGGERTFEIIEPPREIEPRRLLSVTVKERQ